MTATWNVLKTSWFSLCMEKMWYVLVHFFHCRSFLRSTKEERFLIFWVACYRVGSLCTQAEADPCFFVPWFTFSAPFWITSQFRCAKHSASCFAVCRTCWKVQALSFCLVLRCLSDVLEGSSFIAVWSVSYFVMLLKNFVGVIYQSLRKMCATSGPCTSTRKCFVLNGSRCLIELTRCGRKSNQPSSVAWPLCQWLANTEQIKNVFYCRLSFTMFGSC